MRMLRKTKHGIVRDKNGHARVATRQEADTAAKLLAAHRSLAQALDEGATLLLRAEYLPELIAEMGKRLTERFGDAAAPIISALTVNRHDRKPPLRLSAQFERTHEMACVVHAEIPSLRQAFRTAVL